MIEGSSAAQWLSTITAFGVSPCFLTASSDARITQDAPSVICEELPAVHLAPWPLEYRLEGGQFLRRGIRPHAVIVVVELAVTCEDGFDLALEEAALLRMRQPLVAFGRHRRLTVRA